MNDSRLSRQLLRSAATVVVLGHVCACSSEDGASGSGDGASNATTNTATVTTQGSLTTTGATTTSSTANGTVTSTTGGSTATTSNTVTSTTGGSSSSSVTSGFGGTTSATTTTEGTVTSANSAGGATSTTEATVTSTTGGGEDLELFSFFVTSLEGLQRLSGSQDGFGGDLRYGEADGLTGADKICTELAEESMPGSGAKVWHAFLSTSTVNAIDRVGSGPWYDRLGRILAMTPADLLNARPNGADPAIVDDLPNEYGVPNQQPDPNMPAVDNHHFLTGSNEDGELYGSSAACNDWTSTEQSAGRPRTGFSWPSGNRQHWISGQDEGGCGAGVVLTQMGGSDPSNPIVGSGGGYGGFYCFAMTP